MWLKYGGAPGAHDHDGNRVFIVDRVSRRNRCHTALASTGRPRPTPGVTPPQAEQWAA
jgi:hypothetical protein